MLTITKIAKSHLISDIKETAKTTVSETCCKFLKYTRWKEFSTQSRIAAMKGKEKNNKFNLPVSSFSSLDESTNRLAKKNE